MFGLGIKSIIVIVAVSAVFVGGGIFLLRQPESRQGDDGVRWYTDESGNWGVRGNPPACQDPLRLTTPVDIDSASGVLYPGQKRAGDYKAHGGFRFDRAGNDISVVAPMDALIYRAARYTVGGEIQYTFDFIAPCGVMYRFGHLRELSPKLAAISEKLPPPKENDSRGFSVEPGIMVTSGEEIATAIGFIGTGNSFLDFGVYDLRTKNEASKNPEWAKEHDKEQAHHAICWFDLLPAQDASRVWELPTGIEGPSSDFCVR